MGIEGMIGDKTSTTTFDGRRMSPTTIRKFLFAQPVRPVSLFYFLANNPPHFLVGSNRGADAKIQAE